MVNSSILTNLNLLALLTSAVPVQLHNREHLLETILRDTNRRLWLPTIRKTSRTLHNPLLATLVAQEPIKRSGLGFHRRVVCGLTTNIGNPQLLTVGEEGAWLAPQPPFGWGNDSRNKTGDLCFISTGYESCFSRGRRVMSPNSLSTHQVNMMSSRNSSHQCRWPSAEGQQRSAYPVQSAEHMARTNAMCVRREADHRRRTLLSPLVVCIGRRACVNLQSCESA